MTILKSKAKDFRGESVTRVRKTMEMDGQGQGHILAAASAISDSEVGNPLCLLETEIMRLNKRCVLELLRARKDI